MPAQAETLCYNRRMHHANSSPAHSQNQCSNCKTRNDSSAIVCTMCGLRLPWANMTGASGQLTNSETQILAPGGVSSSRANAVTPISPAATAGQKFCNHCGAPNNDTASFCSSCGQTVSSVAVQQPLQPPPTHYFSSPDGPNVSQPVNISVTQQQNNSGWWAAALLLIFGTPLGCIAIPLMLVLLAVFFQFAPILIAVAVAVVIGKSALDNQYKAMAIAGVLLTGLIINGVMWSQTGFGAANRQIEADKAVATQSISIGNTAANITSAGSEYWKQNTITVTGDVRNSDSKERGVTMEARIYNTANVLVASDTQSETIPAGETKHIEVRVNDDTMTNPFTYRLIQKEE